MEARIRAWSYSRLEVYEKCPYQAYLKFVRKQPEPPSEKRDIALNRGRDTHDEAEAFVRGDVENLPNSLSKFKKAFETKRQSYSEGRAIVEEDWAYDADWQTTDWFGDDAWLRVKLDWMEWLDDEKTSIKIVDYKTGKKFGNEIKHAQQGQLYVIAAFMRYPELETATVQFEYLDHGQKSLLKSYTREEAQKFFHSFNERGQEMTSDTVFSPRPSRIACKWCPYGPDNGDGSCKYGVET